MDLKLYDTFTRAKRIFVPLDWQDSSILPVRRRVRMYVCGPTVYDFAHIGNARPVIVFDVLFRLLRHLAKEKGWGDVVYVRNITDVDDKINARAAEEYPGLPLNEAIRQVTEKTDKQFHNDVAALGCLPPTVEPRATDHIAEMRTLIERLLRSGNAYVAAEHVLFSVPSMPDYGKLARRPLEEMRAGERVAVEAYKRDPMDFVLWKPSESGEPAWPSPAGIKTPGRPGWHIECSAMSWKYLGETFDIHGGGIDLVFPHHENEIAQSRCAFHTAVMANYWMHNGFLQVEGEKMSKSVGNFVTIRELLSGWNGIAWPGEVIRLAMLSTHYRQPIDFSERALEQAQLSLRYFKEFGSGHFNSKPSQEFMTAMNDDLNTPLAITELHRLLKMAREGTYDLAKEMVANPHAQFDPKTHFSPGEQLWAGLELLGINMKKYDPDWRQKRISASQSERINNLVEARNAARKSKNFKESDRIRDELAAMGVVLKDSKDGTTWEIAR
jgi:cysteinyl-tRNA synthetase